MSKPSVYLAGPIRGLTYDESEEWRKLAIQQLTPEIEAFSPLWSKAFLRQEGVIDSSYEYAALSSSRGITTRDRFDVMTRDLLLVNFSDWNALSAGTMIELGWANAVWKPIVGIGKFDHPMVQEIVGFWAEDIDDAVDLIKAILLP